MIKDVFIPEKIAGTYLFARRVLSLHINKTHINACQIYIKGKQISIEKCFEQPIEGGAASEYTSRVAQAITMIIRNADRYNELYTVLNSTHVIFKKMTVPFTNLEQIEMVVPYEIEPLLPFPVHNAVIDFIITNTYADVKSADIFIAAVQNQYIAQHMEFFALAHVVPHVITIDLISIYGLFKQIPSYQKLEGKIAIIGINSHDTYILYIYNGSLYAVRTLAKGLFHIAKMATAGTDVTPAQAMEQLLRFGVEGQSNVVSLQNNMEQALKSFWQEIQFTLLSFSSQVQPDIPMGHILLTGIGASLQHHAAFVTKHLHIPCQLFSVEELVQSNIVYFRDNNPMSSTTLVTLGAVFPNPTTEHFNLKKGDFSTPQTTLLTKQLIVGLVLFLTIMTSFFAHHIWQSRKLEREYRASEQEIVSFLREKFPAAEDEINREEIRDIVEKEIRDQKRLWFGLANPSRLPLLRYLLELTSLVDKDALGFEPERITLTPDLLTIKGRVRDFEALKILERDLSKSPLFSRIEPQDNPSFTMPIRLSSEGGRES